MVDNWVRVKLDSEFFVAGEKVSGEIYVCVVEKDWKILARAKGEERVMIESATGTTSRHASSIFNHQKEIPETHQGKSVLPFTFSLPDFCPSSYALIEKDSDESTISIIVEYTIEVELYFSGSLHSKVFQDFTVYSKTFRSAPTKQYDLSRTILKSCCCIPRGRALIRIDLIENAEHVKYRVEVQSTLNRKIASLITQVVLYTTLTLHDMSLSIRKVVEREVKGKHEGLYANNLFSFEYNPELPIRCAGPNVASNAGKFFHSDFLFEVIAMYDVGFRSKTIQCSTPLIVFPVPLVQEKLILPSDWSIEEKPSEALVFSSGSSYNTISED